MSGPGDGDGPFDEEYWRAFRERARRRVGAQGLLLIAPLGILLAIVKILQPASHSAGDIRDSMEFRLVAYGLAIAFMVALLIGSVRLLIVEHRRADPGPRR